MLYVQFQSEAVLCKIIDMQKIPQPSTTHRAMLILIFVCKMACGKCFLFLSIVYAFFFIYLKTKWRNRKIKMKNKTNIFILSDDNNNNPGRKKKKIYDLNRQTTWSICMRIRTL